MFTIIVWFYLMAVYWRQLHGIQTFAYKQDIQLQVHTQTCRKCFDKNILV